MTKASATSPAAGWRDYYHLTKPGIVRGNVLTTAAGFCLAASLQGHISGGLLLATLAGTALIIASGCVVNNYIDRGIDKAMVRTHQRALVTGRISVRAALSYAAGLLLGGSLLLGFFVNWLTLTVGLFGFICYVGLYGWAKRATEHGTLIGSISGAVPPVAGYTAVTGQLDTATLILFLILVTWQMPHFYAIAIYRQKDYAAAKIPVLPVKKGLATAKRQMVGYIGLFGVATAALSLTGYTGYAYLVFALALTTGWLYLALKGYRTEAAAVWAKKIFLYSLAVIPLMSLAIATGALLP